MGTNADSMLMNFSNNSNTSDNSYKNTGNSSAAAGNQNDQQFGSGDSVGSFAMPQSSSAMTEVTFFFYLSYYIWNIRNKQILFCFEGW